MVTIEFRFPAGRYHATPWDAHVNEGAIEWPPSPWRIARALIAVRHRKCAAEVREQTLEQLIEALADQLPHYYLPIGTPSHLRHYMPGYAPKKKSAFHQAPNTTKVFDAFLHLPPSARLQVTWPDAELSDTQRAALSLLLERLGYLGRAESWVEARLVEDPAECRPANAFARGTRSGDDEPRELVRVLTPAPPAEFARWRAAALDERLTRLLADKQQRAAQKGKQPDKVKLTAKDRQKAEALLPETVYGALHADTGELQQQRWSQPPGSRWIDYERPADGFERAPTRHTRAKSTLPTVARFALASSVPPRLTDTYDFAERVRAALRCRSDCASVFAGHGSDKGPAKGHRHAFIFPEANGGRHGRITHVTIFAREGFAGSARTALDTLRDIRRKHGDPHELQLVLVGVGQPNVFGAGRDSRGVDVGSGECALFARSRVWISRTPFVPTRHPKYTAGRRPKLDASGRHIGSPEHDLVRLLREAGHPEPASVVRLEGRKGGTMLDGKLARWVTFRTHRRGAHGLRSSGRGYGFRIEFHRPVEGPIALGFGAHLGLGQFAPAGVYDR